MNNITISKGAYSVEIGTDHVAEGFTKSIKPITPAQGKENQSSGPKDAIIVDLLMITRVLNIKGHITGTASKTAKVVRNELKSIYNGGGINGGVETLTYDGETIYGFMQKLTIVTEPMDEPDDFESAKENYQEVLKYNVSFDFLEGTAR